MFSTIQNLLRPLLFLSFFSLFFFSLFFVSLVFKKKYVVTIERGMGFSVATFFLELIRFKPPD